eukprot:TRINITY_DN10089_c0_g1_i6.p1 TRINITY_DN10089_c0_g1~~TRINITY_DN10089_c0_g1_i6.p1  ORF type:complete len:527 (+),score=79.21 TRINITY_DN10089_c0_g1_i6:215-1582(+)
MTQGLGSSLRAIFWASCLLFITVLFASIVAVETIHPINLRVAADGVYGSCSRCPRAFESVEASMLTFTAQIIAGDGWSVLTVPIIEKEPLSAIVFVSVLLVINLWVLNLILSVIVDSAHEAREKDMQHALEQKREQFEHAKHSLAQVCKSLDANVDGVITQRELLKGYEENEEFRQHMAVLDAAKEDMPIVFHILDRDKSGTITSDEFVEQLHMMKSQDLHTMMVFLKHHVLTLEDLVRDQFSLMTREIGEIKSHQNVYAKERFGSCGNRSDVVSKKMSDDLSSQCGPQTLVSEVLCHAQDTAQSTHFDTSRLKVSTFDTTHERCADPVPSEETIPAQRRLSPGLSVSNELMNTLVNPSPAVTCFDELNSILLQARKSLKIAQNVLDTGVMLAKEIASGGNLPPIHSQPVLPQVALSQTTPKNNSEKGNTLQPRFADGTEEVLAPLELIAGEKYR